MTVLKKIIFPVLTISIFLTTFLTIQTKANSLVFSTNSQLPFGYKLCVVSPDDPLYLSKEFISGDELDGSDDGDEYSLIAVNNIFCNNANAINSSAPSTFFVFKNHDTYLRINNFLPKNDDNPPVLNITPEYNNSLPRLEDEASVVNICLGIKDPIKVSFVDPDNDYLVESIAPVINPLNQTSYYYIQEQGKITYIIYPDNNSIFTQNNNFTIKFAVKEKNIENNINSTYGVVLERTITFQTISKDDCSKNLKVAESSSSGSTISSENSTVSSTTSSSSIANSSSETSSSNSNLVPLVSNTNNAQSLNSAKGYTVRTGGVE